MINEWTATLQRVFLISQLFKKKVNEAKKLKAELPSGFELVTFEIAILAQPKLSRRF